MIRTSYPPQLTAATPDAATTAARLGFGRQKVDKPRLEGRFGQKPFSRREAKDGPKQSVDGSARTIRVGICEQVLQRPVLDGHGQGSLDCVFWHQSLLGSRHHG